MHRDRLKTDSEKPGWNKWALFGALASLLWLFLDQYSKDDIVIWDSLLVLFCFMVGRSIVERTGFLNTKESPNVERKYKAINEEIQAGTVTAVYSIAMYTFFFLLFRDLQSKPWYLIFLPKAYCLISASMLGLVILLRKFTFLLPDDLSSNKAVSKTANLGVVVIFLVAVFTLISAFYLIEDFENVKMIRTALIFIACYYVIEKLLTEFQTNPLLDSINELIDDVTFKNLNIDEANTKLRMIVIGSDYNEIIAGRLKDYLRLRRNIDTGIFQFSGRIAEIKECGEAEKKSKKEQLALDKVQLISYLEQLEKLEKSIRKTLLNFLPFEYKDQRYHEIMELIFAGKQYRISKMSEIDQKFATVR